MSDNPKVFISYSHQDKDYEKKVYEFANRLRMDGIDASVDLYVEAPIEGWPSWMEKQIMWADYVIVLASKSYHDKYYTNVNGKGVSWEVRMVYQSLYDENCETTKYIPAFFEDNDSEYILMSLKSFTYYNVSREDQYEKLYMRLCGVNKYQKPELGKLRVLEPKKQRTSMIVSTPDGFVTENDLNTRTNSVKSSVYYRAEFTKIMENLSILTKRNGLMGTVFRGMTEKTIDFSHHWERGKTKFASLLNETEELYRGISYLITPEAINDKLEAIISELNHARSVADTYKLQHMVYEYRGDASVLDDDLYCGYIEIMQRLPDEFESLSKEIRKVVGSNG